MNIVSEILLLAIPLIWCGMIAAISFIEAPLKFRAPGVTLPVGLGIGRLVFRTLNRTEWAMAIIWLASALASKTSFTSLMPASALIIILALQSLWLLPHLGRRADMIRAGLQPEGSSLHIYYIAGEAVKLVLLAGSGSQLLYELIKQ